LLARLHIAVAAGNDKGDASPVIGNDGGQLELQGAEPELVIPVASPRMAQLEGDQVAVCQQLVALDGGVVVNGPLIILEDFDGVVNTNHKTPFRINARLMLPG